MERESRPHYITRLRATRDLQYRDEVIEAEPTVWGDPNRVTRRRTSVGIEASEHDAFCNCWKKRMNECICGETGKTLEWVWDVGTKSNCTHLINGNRDVRFHLHFSGGTAVIRGNRSIAKNQHYWEVKMTTLVYGTDMMVGIGTKDADFEKLSDKFCSVLGIDSETWGLSYTGLFHHQGMAKPFASGFGQGSIVGVHLDMWNGTLSFYKNRQPLGVACRGLKGKTLYPMVSSTAARSGMRIIHSVSFPSSLQFLCCVALRKAVSPDQSVFDVVPMPPGMQMFLSNNLGWLLGECHSTHSFVPHEIMGKTSSALLPFATSQACQHKHLTCSDCNTPVFSGSNKGGEEIFHELMPSHLLQVGPILLQRYRPQSHNSDSSFGESSNRRAIEDRHDRFLCKRRKLVHPYYFENIDDEDDSD